MRGINGTESKAAVRPEGRRALLLSAVLAALALALPAPAASAEAPERLWRTCEKGSGAGECHFPYGMASDPVKGHLFVADRANNRIVELSAWGEFVKAWGWGVRDGSEEAQTCTDETGCQAGIAGSGAGQLDSPIGVAVDSAGEVYVYERNNRRVQKFDSEGELVLMFGADVNKTEVEAAAPEAQRNVCTAASGDVCQAGVSGTGPGEFSTDSFGAFLASSPADVVYVGDKERIQEFDIGGTYSGEVPLAANKTVRTLAVDPGSGEFYLGLLENGFVEARFSKIDSAGETLCTSELGGPGGFGGAPNGFAVRSDGGLYTALREEAGAFSRRHVVEFDSECTPTGLTFADGELSNSTSLALGTACFSEGGLVYLSNGDPNRTDGHFISAYGPAPDKLELCPPPADPPDILAQWASGVEATGATLKAQINPRFWQDTTYYLEYGTEPCSEGGCAQQPAAPGTPLGAGTVSKSVTIPGLRLEGLTPGATYHYRFTAISHCRAEEPEFECTTVGPEQSFTTFRAAGDPSAECPNRAFREGSAAFLPDCRAYELVSPLDKEGGDVISLDEGTSHYSLSYTQSALSGDRVTYSAYRAFGEPESAPFTSQYLASRGAGGWQSEGISPPRGRATLPVTGILVNEYKIFSPDLCQGWLRAQYDPPLAPGATERYSNLYRRDLCGEGGFEALTTEAPTHESSTLVGYPGEHYFSLSLQGLADEGEAAIYAVSESFAGASPQPPECLAEDEDCELRLYLRAGGETHSVCVLPDTTPNPGPCSAGLARDDHGKADRDGVSNAISADGDRVFWTAARGFNASPGPIYARLNPTEPESARELGVANGSGDLIGPARGGGDLINSSTKINNVGVLSGGFAVGQEISGEGIAAGAKITKVQEPSPGVFRLTMDKPATATVSGTEVTGAASAAVFNATADSGAFAAGQEVSGAGLEAGTTIVAVGEGTLTLSAPASETAAGATLSATSPCEEAETRACTVAVSSEAEALEGTASSEYWTAAADGSRAVFASGKGLYEFDVDTGVTTRIAGGIGGFPAFMGASENAKRVYFVSIEDLGGGAQAGGRNLYLYEAGAGVRFIATLVAQDFENLSPSSFTPESYRHSGRVSGDGLHAAFVSWAPLTGYDNRDARTATPAAEAYLYDASAEGGAGRLLCVSCNPSGARPLAADLGRMFGKSPGSGSGKDEAWVAGHIPPSPNDLYSPRALAEDGSHLFFEAADALAPRDTNGRVDVYQWEQPGSGGCTTASPGYSAVNGGCIDLISSGQSAEDSRFLDADPEGSDVFFATAESLAGGDYGLVDLYDARAGGGYPPPPPTSASCEGEACQSPPAAPRAPTPASSSFRGPGNVSEAPDLAGRCARAARQARARARAAGRARRAAIRSAAKSPRGARQMRRRARRLTRSARRLSRGAKRCRARARQGRRAGR